MTDKESCGGFTEELKFALTSPEKLREHIKAQGIDITPEQAIQVAELLDQLSNIIISQHLRQCK
jgi:hypothetical protein